jgi:hypothetical protein
MNDAESQADEMRLPGMWWASQTVSRSKIAKIEVLPESALM